MDVTIPSVIQMEHDAQDLIRDGMKLFPALAIRRISNSESRSKEVSSSLERRETVDLPVCLDRRRSPVYPYSTLSSSFLHEIMFSSAVNIE